MPGASEGCSLIATTPQKPGLSKQEHTLKALLRRARRASEAQEIAATPQEKAAVRMLLLPAAIRHAQDNLRRLPKYTTICGCRVYVSSSLAGEVFVFAARDGVMVASSNPFRV